MNEFLAQNKYIWITIVYNLDARVEYGGHVCVKIVNNWISNNFTIRRPHTINYFNQMNLSDQKQNLCCSGPKEFGINCFIYCLISFWQRTISKLNLGMWLSTLTCTPVWLLFLKTWNWWIKPQKQTVAVIIMLKIHFHLFVSLSLTQSVCLKIPCGKLRYICWRSKIALRSSLSDLGFSWCDLFCMYTQACV